MSQNVLTGIEDAVDRLIRSYNDVKAENSRLSGELTELRSNQERLKSKLDDLIAKIEGAVAK